MSLLRRIWEMLMELEPGRRKSPPHEARWLNLLGYCLRPGYGLAVDDWRVAETWKTVQGKLAHSAATSRTESLILWRRIAGGFRKANSGLSPSRCSPQFAPCTSDTRPAAKSPIQLSTRTNRWKSCGSSVPLNS